jgi:hypothetical protein
MTCGRQHKTLCCFVKALGFARGGLKFQLQALQTRLEFAK